MNQFRIHKFVSFIVCCTLTFHVYAQSFRSAQQLASEMKIGWNIGNTMEALYEYNGTIVAGETAWGNSAITQTLINSVKAAGFNTIRIPVAWDVHATNSVIDAAWIARVKEVVDYCMNSDVYVILNIHWDHGWLEENCNPAVQTSVNQKQQAYWTQIANYFKAYDDRLLFASANEPNVDDATQMAVLLSYHQTFINAVRATGGNNLQRTLIVQGPRTDIEKTNDLMNTMPTDVVSGRMMAEIHFYPYQFCLMDADAGWGNQFYYWGACNHSTTDAAHNPTWGEEAWVDEMFQLMKTKFVNNGIPVIMGEFGVRQRTNLTGDAFALHEKSREYFLKYVVKSALNHGIIPVYWCAGLKDLFNRNTGAVLDQNALHALMAGAYSTGSSVNCGTNDCLGVAKGHAYINDCGDCVLGYEPCAVNTPPEVSVTSPSQSDTFAEGGSITIQANASDSDGNVVKVEFYEGTTKLGEDSSFPFSYTWTNVPAGTYVLTAVATDNNGLTTTSAQISITVLGVDCNGVTGGSAYVDNCNDCVGGNTGKTPCLQIKAQAEDVSCSFDGIIESNNAGFEGTGFINGDNAANTTIKFRITTEESTAVLFGVQYANGGTADRPCKILVNGLEQVTSLSMPVTGWTNYQSSETTIQLSTGINEITLVAIDNSGFANIDFYYIYGNATFGTCDMTQTIALNPGWNLFSVSVIDTTGLNGSTDAINFDSTDAINRVSTIFENMDVQIVKNADGFWNPNQPDEFNSLQNIEPGKGYLVYMNTATTLEITGIPSVQTLHATSLSDGWNMIGYPCTGESSFAPLPISDYFDETNCQTIKNFDGYWEPNGIINSIQNFEMGKGYFILK